MARKRFFVAIRIVTSDGPRYVVRRWDTYHHTVPKIIGVREAAHIAHVSKTAMTAFLAAGFAGQEPDSLDISDWVNERIREDNKARVARAKR